MAFTTGPAGGHYSELSTTELSTCMMAAMSGRRFGVRVGHYIIPWAVAKMWNNGSVIRSWLMAVSTVASIATDDTGVLCIHPVRSLILTLPDQQVATRH